MAVAGVLTIAMAGCDGKDAATKAKEKAAALTITPVNGTVKVRPDLPIVVRAHGGRLRNVAVTSNGRPVPGKYSADGGQWRSDWTLNPNARVVVRANAVDHDGDPVAATSNFTTLRPRRTFRASQDPVLEDAKKETYGVGLPIIVNFNRAVTNRAAVQRALQVKAQKPVPGAWRWMSNKQVIYRAATFWPAHQTITLTAHLAGIRGAQNVYGLRDFVRTYRIGRAQIARLNIKKHRMKVTWDGKVVRKVPISAGMGGSTEYTTTSGIHLNMEKATEVTMTSPGRGPGDAGYYSELVHYVVRITNMGEYLHETPGDEGCLGTANCSHGCVRQPADDAIWYYKHSQPGDPVIIKGTDRKVDYNDGWSFYQMPFAEWQRGGAIK